MAGYNAQSAVDYAHKWAYGRNPAYYNFESIGGDCTNFVSQCLYAGCGVMNYTPVRGWYYNSLSSRSAAWSGAPYLQSFLLSNDGPGPFGRRAALGEARPGDVVQLCFDSKRFSHSLLVVAAGLEASPENILLATHSMDSDYRPLISYVYTDVVLIHIEGAGE